MAMKYLLDTHTLLWWLFDDPQLSLKATKIISDSANHIYVSSISAWEISAKHKSGILQDLDEFMEKLPSYVRKERFEILPINLEHGIVAGKLSSKHKDPFDRMLIAQALVESVPIITSERVFKEFSVEVVW